MYGTVYCFYSYLSPLPLFPFFHTHFEFLLYPCELHVRWFMTQWIKSIAKSIYLLASIHLTSIYLLRVNLGWKGKKIKKDTQGTTKVLEGQTPNKECQWTIVRPLLREISSEMHKNMSLKRPSQKTQGTALILLHSGTKIEGGMTRENSNAWCTSFIVEVLTISRNYMVEIFRRKGRCVGYINEDLRIEFHKLWSRVVCWNHIKRCPL